MSLSVNAHKFLYTFSTKYAKEREECVSAYEGKCDGAAYIHYTYVCYHFIIVWHVRPMHKWNRIRTQTKLHTYIGPAMLWLFLFFSFSYLNMFFFCVFVFQFDDEVNDTPNTTTSTCIMNQRTLWPTRSTRLYNTVSQNIIITIHTHLVENLTSRFATIRFVFLIFLCKKKWEWMERKNNN